MKYFVEVENGFICNNRTPKNLKEAFEKSIEKWELIAGGGISFSSCTDSCGLCNLYRSEDCVNCPIFKETKRAGCQGFKEFRDYVFGDSAPVLNKLKEWQKKYVPKSRILESSILFYPRKDTNQVTVQFIHNGDIHSETFDGDMENALQEVREMLLKEETADYVKDTIRGCFADPTSTTNDFFRGAKQ